MWVPLSIKHIQLKLTTIKVLLPGEEGAPPPVIIPARSSSVDIDESTGLPWHIQTAFTEFKFRWNELKSLDDFVEYLELGKLVKKFYHLKFGAEKWDEAIAQDVENYFLILQKVRFKWDRKYQKILMFLLKDAEEDVRLFAYSQLVRIIPSPALLHLSITDEYRCCLKSLTAFMPR